MSGQEEKKDKDGGTPQQAKGKEGGAQLQAKGKEVGKPPKPSREELESLAFLIDDMDVKSLPFDQGADYEPPVFRSASRQAIETDPIGLGEFDSPLFRSAPVTRNLKPLSAMDSPAVTIEIPGAKRAPLVEIKRDYPKRPPAGHLERTHVQTTAKPSKVMEDLKKILEELDVDFELTDETFQYSCVFYPRGERVQFMLQLFEKSPGQIVLEVQRHWGDAVHFYRMYQDLIDAAAKRKLVVARDPKRPAAREDSALVDELEPLTEEDLRETLEPLIEMAGSRYLDVSSRAVESLCDMATDTKISAWLGKNGHIANAIKLAGDENECVHRPAVTWIANMARNKELCEELATTEALATMARMLTSNCKEVVRESSRALENLSAVIGPEKILSAAKISDAMAQRMAGSADRRTRASWAEMWQG